MHKHRLSRKDFLKFAGLGVASAVLIGCEKQVAAVLPTLTPSPAPTVTPLPSATSTPTLTATPEPTATSTPEPWQLGAQIESRIPATQVPVIEYHYPGYSAAGVKMPPDLFASQMDFLKESGFRAITDAELANFLAGQAVLPARTIALRIDQAAAHFDEFDQMMAIIEAAGLSAMVYVIAGDQYTDENWNKFVDWINRGVITLGSHSVSHPDFRKISSAQAYNEAVTSKREIEAQLAKRGVQTEVISFAFPYDSIPDNLNFLKTAGYKFCLGGILYDFLSNSAKPGQFLLPTVYSYVTDGMLETVQANARYNPRSIILNSGYVFDELIFRSSTPVTLADVERVIGGEYAEMTWGNFRSLPVSPWQETYLLRPAGIIMHTDDQSGNDFKNWNTTTTYNGLLSRGTDCHLAVGLDGVAQFLRMYPSFCAPGRGALGFSNYISIEMCGRYFGDVLVSTTDPAKKDAIQNITQKAVALVKDLMKHYNIGFDKVLGHYEASASGKTDPGQKYMDQVFRPLLQASL
jgi:peptidoglycan/xylan/chitin deacetylase (PgdA/CDA1 family)